MTKSAQTKGVDPLMWALELSSTLLSAGETMPSTKVAELLVNHICWSNNVPIAWKFLEKALSIRVAPPMLVLALLSNRFCNCGLIFDQLLTNCGVRIVTLELL